eukprot:CAMPEP_0180647204 /NCGR_PEP_ID=MMETSP1037_2-20121125/50162_1 /TAXON_ID=632150 /ORGANISM="Azadinium spinosum, Strain 3D9" /LENGTH=235 /DNA_ID=CAMNT_0022671641 /DNA_START=54 /DNA_END=758 /DNA_ORIENTATION=+
MKQLGIFCMSMLPLLALFLPQVHLPVLRFYGLLQAEGDSRVSEMKSSVDLLVAVTSFFDAPWQTSKSKQTMQLAFSSCGAKDGGLNVSEPEMRRKLADCVGKLAMPLLTTLRANVLFPMLDAAVRAAPESESNGAADVLLRTSRHSEAVALLRPFVKKANASGLTEENLGIIMMWTELKLFQAEDDDIQTELMLERHVELLSDRHLPPTMELSASIHVVLARFYDEQFRFEAAWR